ncbi:carbon storage regulator CsrA [Haloimpatiens sp. FM7330]|uniref:carbon storage regulator CsrA n=1 Tax=Haloimpatiens sp. FM7330 TaxID=3298610 RepID=UPI0036259246
MLVVKRKKGEAILIGDNIEINIVDMENNSVKIAIDAPRSIRILRKELLKEVENENKQAITFNKDILNKLKK